MFKNRDFGRNFLFLMISVVIGSELYFNSAVIIFKIIGLSTLVLFLVVAFFYKKFNYEIIIVTQNYDPIKAKIMSDAKDDAKQFVLKVNGKLRTTLLMRKAC